MSSAPRSAPPPPGSTEATGLSGDVERGIAFAGPYLEGLLSKSAPTPVVLRALADELGRATAGGSVAHPELVDPDVYWQKAAWPQAASVVKHARRALVQLTEELESSMTANAQSLEAWLAARVEEDATVPVEERDAVRDAAIDAIASRCEAMHRTFERLAAITPDRTSLVAARAEVEEAARRRAVEDVKDSRDEVAKEHPELDKAAFKQLWIDTLDARVAERSTVLLGEIPHRHQDLLVTAFERALDAIDADIAGMIAELTQPILGIGEKLVRRYDELFVAASIGNGVAEPR